MEGPGIRKKECPALNTEANVSKPKFLAVDFFCGAGGTTRGLIDAGGYVVAGVDKAVQCAETFERNNVNLDGVNARYLTKDIFKQEEDYPEGQQMEVFVELNEMLQPLQDRYPDVPLLFSICAPCQPFTSMTRIEMSNERSAARVRDRGLLGQSLAYIDEFVPEMIICENVAGIQKASYGGVWQHFAKGLEDRGYVVGSAIVNAMKFGVPQSRKRSIMLAVHRNALKEEFLEGRDASDPELTLEVPLEDAEAGIVTVRETLARFPAIKAGGSEPSIPNHRCANLSDLNKRRLMAAEPGGTNFVFAGTDMELDCHKKMRATAEFSGGFSDVYTRLDPDKPAPTMTTKCFSVSNGRYGHFDPTQVRAISVREAAALQSFPDNYEFLGGSIQADARMVGNAVPPRLAEFFARHLMRIAGTNFGRSETELAA